MSESAQMVFAKQSLAKMKALAETLKELPPTPVRMQLMSHAELCAVVWLFGEAEKLSEKFVEMFKAYASGVEETKALLNNKGTRAEVIARLERMNKDAGLF